MARYSVTIQYHERGEGRASAARDDERFVEAHSIATARAEARGAFTREHPSRRLLGMVCRRVPDLPRHNYSVRLGFVPAEGVIERSYQISNCVSDDEAVAEARRTLDDEFPGHQLVDAEARRVR